MGTLVTLHVYDVTNSGSGAANNAIITLNRLFKDTWNIGGVFHCGVEVNREEWSFGFCEQGTGVYNCPPRGNTMYTYRESIPVGVTTLSPYRLRQLISLMMLEWPGNSYDLLARNCNHFCCAFAEALGAGPIPTWVNSLPTWADGVCEATNTVYTPFRVIGSSVGSFFGGMFGFKSSEAGTKQIKSTPENEAKRSEDGDSKIKLHNKTRFPVTRPVAFTPIPDHADLQSHAPSSNSQ
mmetsp:Transcript_8634/g.14872  ORF Transcript_8634/g.14872 Transcript_8634/m.14872 type:complete len:237 (-) Transcript_8634:218-928(-)